MQDTIVPPLGPLPERFAAERSPAHTVQISAERAVELTARCVDLVRRAILTLSVQPDREAAFFRVGSTMPTPVRDAAEAYGYQVARRGRFRPTPLDVSRYIEVLGWLTWLEGRNMGARDVRIITAKAFDVPLWKLAAQFGKSDETIRRWEKDAYAALTMRYWRRIDGMR